MADQSGSHDGHRARMRKRYNDGGFKNFHDHEILEIILYNCYTRRNTNDIAHKLLDTFGSISAVFDAPVDLLMKTGVSESVATYLHMIPDICRVYFDDRNNSRRKIIKLDEICDYFQYKFIGRVEEAVYLLLMDAKCKELFCGIVAEGNNCTSDVPMRKIVDLAMRYNATYAILSHNHPSGVAFPSKADLEATKQLLSILSTIGVLLVDHVIVADEDILSMRDSVFSSCFLIEKE